MKKMKKTLYIVVLCAFLILMPTFLAFPIANKTSNLFSPLKMLDGTFAGGFGRGHWSNGKFHIDIVYAYMNGVYASRRFLIISGEITKNYEKIVEIKAYIINNKIIFGRITNNYGQKATLFGILKENKNNQIVCRIYISSMYSAYMWILLIPNK